MSKLYIILFYCKQNKIVIQIKNNSCISIETIWYSYFVVVLNNKNIKP